ncbi:MAG: FadR family transcriptional regulator, partial [Deltaproteobacteria bacterium]|nr:FadR family transcriptional regulator [Deltaproteobacteria bacterium]
MKEELKIKSVERKSLTELISEQIQRHILNGIFKPGEKLPPERELARMLNVTRTTLREALKKLEGVKLVLIRQGDGITVQDFRKSDNLFILKELLFEGDRVDSGILGNLLEARKLFLVPMTRLALERADSGDRKEYERLVMELEKNVSDAGLVQELDFNCFELLARASGNLVFVFIFNSIRGIYFSHR